MDSIRFLDIYSSKPVEKESTPPPMIDHGSLKRSPIGIMGTPVRLDSHASIPSDRF